MQTNDYIECIWLGLEQLEEAVSVQFDDLEQQKYDLQRIRETRSWLRENNGSLLELQLTQYSLLLDNVVIFTGTANECFEWVHKNTSYSFDLAIKQGGYSMQQIK